MQFSPWNFLCYYWDNTTMKFWGVMQPRCPILINIKRNWWVGILINLHLRAGLFLWKGIGCDTGLLWFMQKGESAPTHSKNSTEVSEQSLRSIVRDYFLWEFDRVVGHFFYPARKMKRVWWGCGSEVAGFTSDRVGYGDLSPTSFPMNFLKNIC